MKALFLDIDGVLQPRGWQKRFKHLKEIPIICAQLNKTKHNDFDYEAYIHNSYSGLCDIGAVWYDWDKPSVERLRHILEETKARIVISSDWRSEGWERIKGLLAIHDLDNYLYGMTYYLPRCKEDCKKQATEETAWRKAQEKLYEEFHKLYPTDPNNWFSVGIDYRMLEIREYLDRHPEITAYGAIDDRNIGKGLEGHFVCTDNSITEKNMELCIEILSREDGPYPLEMDMHTPELQEWREKYIFNRPI